MADTCRKMPILDELLLPLRNAREITKATVQAFLRDLRPNAACFAETAEFSDVHPYGRRLLLQTPAVEVLVMGFHARNECPPHDHGGSDGLVLVCGGTAAHSIYRRKQSNLTLVERALEPVGSILDAPVDCVHAMGNPGPEPLITLHVYWPPIEHMTVFDIGNRKIYEVNGKAGAWLPVDTAALIETHELK